MQITSFSVLIFNHREALFYIIDSYEKLSKAVNLAFDKPDMKATACFGIIAPDYPW